MTTMQAVPRREARWLSAAETAKLVRAALKREFPGVKFSVTSSTYSGGASIRVNYGAGPRLAEVDRVAKRFEGSDFGGSIDLKTSHSSRLMPDGTVCIAKDHGTQGSMGFIPAQDNPAPSPDAELVRLGADFVSADRDTDAPEVLSASRAKVAALVAMTGVTVEELERTSLNVPSLVHCIACKLDTRDGSFDFRRWHEDGPRTSDEDALSFLAEASHGWFWREVEKIRDTKAAAAR